MFKSVIERQRAGRLGTGTWVSIGVHAALFAAVLFISARPPEPPPEKDPLDDLRIIVQRGPSVRRGTPAPAPPKQATPPRPKPPERNRVPRTPQPLPTQPRPPEPDPTPSPGRDDVVATPAISVEPEGHPDGDPDSLLPDGPLPTSFPTDLVRKATDVENLPFGDGMTPPVMLSGAPIEYTSLARAAEVEGTLIAKCVITREGQMRDCRVLKGLAYMDEAVVEALETRRYRPVTFQGSPVSVSYHVTVRLKLPR
ncbi:energy transducer TonB [Pyxidicoccus sp. MSG2]|uniref:energy transducer TonB n=1 Tax=Pyxidicoccus sp. MSG2 TaxID=2996790 RepID=UPI00227020C0|nr:energy transducer TonB [Pyxidicoccus sp. MSG2]MCY1015096.1 energy transducer TonB [Pyxidicoccus sp. MSG2]